MSTTPTINAQLPGPIAANLSDIGPLVDIRTADSSRQVAECMVGPETAALMAAAYSAFDRAGRSLGVDATELARSVDLAALIRSAHELRRYGLVQQVLGLTERLGYSEADAKATAHASDPIRRATAALAPVVALSPRL